MIEFKAEERGKYTLIEIELEDTIAPDVLKAVSPPKVDLRKGVVISGRAPIWLYCFLTHYYHPASWVATFDPRIGAVVVESHSPKYKVGDVIEVI